MLKEEILEDIPIYWINLAREKDRRAKMEQLLEGLNNTRISAYDGDKLTEAEVRKYNQSKQLDRNLTKYEIACALSHLKTLKKIYYDGHPYALVLEDDINFDYFPHIGFRLKDVAELSETCIQLSIMCSDNRKWYKLRRFGEGEFVEDINYDSAGAYLIHRDYISKVLFNSKNLTVADDPHHNFIYSEKSVCLNIPMFCLDETSKVSSVNPENINYQQRMTVKWEHYMLELKKRMNIEEDEGIYLNRIREV